MCALLGVKDFFPNVREDKINQDDQLTMTDSQLRLL